MTRAIGSPRFLQSELYRLYYRPHGVVHHAYRDLRLHDRPARLVIGRNVEAPDFDADELDIIDRLANHLERSCNLAQPRPPSVEAGDSLAQAARIFAFTPAELRLVRPLSTGSGLHNAADQLGITINTAKSRLRVIFEKTGTHSQAQLVRVLLETATPGLPH